MTKTDVNSLLQEHGDKAGDYIRTLSPDEIEKRIEEKEQGKGSAFNGRGGKGGAPEIEDPPEEEPEEQEGQKSEQEDDGSVPPAGLYIDTGKPLKQFPYQVKYTLPRRGRGILVGQSGGLKDRHRNPPWHCEWPQQQTHMENDR
jgi:hypothetical protein